MPKPKRIAAIALAGLIFTSLASFAAEPQGKRVRPLPNPSKTSEDGSSAATSVFEKVSKSVVIVEALSSDGMILQGSGVVYESFGTKSGKLFSHIVTNAHVVKDARSVSVLQGDKRYQAYIYSVDSEFDLALLSVLGVLLPASSPSYGAGLKVGEKVFAIGSPMGLENTISEGIISGRRKQNGVLLLQTTAPISKGSSGGGLFDTKGRFVGVTTFKLVDGENLNFAVSAGRVPTLEDAEDAAVCLQIAAKDVGHFSPNEMAIINSDALMKWLLNNGSERNEVLDRQNELDRTQANSPGRTAALDKVDIESVQILGRFLSEKLVAKGIVSDESGDHNDAINAYSRAIELNPKYGAAYFNRGCAYYALGNYGQAIKDYEKAIEFNPNDAKVYYNRGNAYDELGNRNQAIRDYDKAIELNPRYTWAYNNRGNAYSKFGNYSQAIKDYNKAIEVNPNDAAAYVNRGGTYYDLGKYNQAIEDFDKAIELNPKVAAAYWKRGKAYEKLGKHEQATEDYNRAMDETEPNKAIEIFSKSIELNPKVAGIYWKRGNAYYKLAKYDQAIKDYDKVIELDPKNAEAYCLRGLAYNELGNVGQAIKDVKIAARLGLKLAQDFLRKSGLSW